MTPLRRPSGCDFTPTRQAVNRALSAARAPVERGVAGLKSWRILRRSRCSPRRMSSIAAAVLTRERQGRKGLIASCGLLLTAVGVGHPGGEGTSRRSDGGDPLSGKLGKFRKTLRSKRFQGSSCKVSTEALPGLPFGYGRHPPRPCELPLPGAAALEAGVGSQQHVGSRVDSAAAYLSAGMTPACDFSTLHGLLPGGPGEIPYEGAARRADQLGGKTAVELTYRGRGHSAYGQGSCVTSAADDYLYLLNAKIPVDGAGCS